MLKASPARLACLFFATEQLMQRAVALPCRSLLQPRLPTIPTAAPRRCHMPTERMYPWPALQWRGLKAFLYVVGVNLEEYTKRRAHLYG